MGRKGADVLFLAVAVNVCVCAKGGIEERQPASQPTLSLASYHFPLASHIFPPSSFHPILLRFPPRRHILHAPLTRQTPQHTSSLATSRNPLRTWTDIAAGMDGRGGEEKKVIGVSEAVRRRVIKV